MSSVTFVTPYALLGGAERYLQDLLTRIDPRSVDGVVVLQRGPFVDRLRECGFEPLVIHTSASKLSMIRAALRLRRVLGRAPKVIHANGIKAALVSELASVGRPHRVIWVKHDFSWDGRIARAAARFAHTVVGVSAAVLADLGHPRMAVISPGIDVREVDRDTARRALLDELSLDEDVVLVALVGRLHPVKGHREVLEALPMVIRRTPSVAVLFVGGPEPTQLHYAAEIDAASRRASAPVLLLGHRSDVLQIVAACDVVVAPSVIDDRGMGREGAGIALLEAMSVGTPVVAYDDGGIPEIVGDAGILVPTGDRSALADAITQLASDPQLAATLRSRAMTRVASRFAIERTVEEMRRIYAAAGG